MTQKTVFSKTENKALFLFLKCQNLYTPYLSKSYGKESQRHLKMLGQQDRINLPWPNLWILNSIVSLANHTKLITILISTQNDCLRSSFSCKVHEATRENLETNQKRSNISKDLIRPYKYITLSSEATFINTKYKNNLRYSYIKITTRKNYIIKYFHCFTILLHVLDKREIHFGAEI